jgi:hypothetical protein
MLVHCPIVLTLDDQVVHIQCRGVRGMPLERNALYSIEVLDHGQQADDWINGQGGYFPGAYVEM